jgi:hypothetical protein
MLIMFVLLTAGAVVSGGTATATPASPPSPARAGEPEKVQVTVPIVYKREAILYNNGLNTSCYAIGLVYFADLQGYQPYSLSGNTTAPGYPSHPYLLNISAPYDDAQLFHGQSLNQPGMHKYAIAEEYIFSSPPFRDCAPESATQQATWGASTVLTYTRSDACVMAQQDVVEAQAKVKAATKALKHASAGPEKRKAKKKLKKAKKKLTSAQGNVAQLC